METINVTKETKNKFDIDILNLRMKEKRNIFADEFVNILLSKLKGGK